MRTYLITAGTFKRDDGSIAATGEHIDLPDDIAWQCAHQLQPLPDAATGQSEHHE